MRYQAAVITVSDKGAAGERADTSGPALCSMLREAAWEVTYTAIVPDEKERIAAALIDCADAKRVPLILTTGGTGFSQRDVTPEATLAVLERRAPGIPEAMRAESMRITPRGCLSRGEAGLRGGSLIVNLPGSEKAATESLACVLPALRHSADMLASAGSADCAAAGEAAKKTPPSPDEWLREAKRHPDAEKCGMYLTHNGTVRRTARDRARDGADVADVTGMDFSYDEARVDAAVAAAYRMPGVYYVRVWLNTGKLSVGEDIMYVLLGGDTRPHVIAALESLVGEIKTRCVTEKEL